MSFLSFPNPSAFLLITHFEDFAVSSKTLHLRLCRWVGISGKKLTKYQPMTLSGPLLTIGSDYSGKEPTCQFRSHRRHRFNPQVGKIPWRRA